ncbi:unnamed protein product, partial [Brassica rapa]
VSHTDVSATAGMQRPMLHPWRVVRSRLWKYCSDQTEFFFWQDTLMLGTDYYLTESGIASLLAEGKVPIGIGRETKIR